MKRARQFGGFGRRFSGFAVICSAAIAGAWSAVLFLNAIVPIAEDDFDSAPSVERATCVRSSGASRGVRGKGWMADVWSGPRRTGAFRVSGFAANGSAETQGVDSRAARRGFGATLRRALRQRGKAPLDERYARRAWDPFDTPEARRRSRGGAGHGGDSDEGPVIYEGDVFISGLPMIDQGRGAYCAVATAARVLQGYGIEVTMEDLAKLAHTSSSQGTSQKLWEEAIGKVASDHGLKLTVIPELTETSTPLKDLLSDYNDMAHDMDYPELCTSKYVSSLVSNYKAYDEDRAYDVQREVMLSSDPRSYAFDANVTARIDESDPIFWTVLLGDVPEEVPHGNDTFLSADKGAHMRLIIGYNEDRGEVLYSDSWGEGHELKRMDAADALSITTAMYYLSE